MNQAKAVNAIKGAVRKAFTWYSEEYKEAYKRATVRVLIKDKDGNPTGRFRDFVECAQCKNHFYKKDTQIDHIEPVGKAFDWPLNETFLVWFHKLWCSVDNLQALCKDCHSAKCKLERKQGKYK